MYFWYMHKDVLHLIRTCSHGSHIFLFHHAMEGMEKMKRLWLIPLAIFLIGIILDQTTTYFALNKGFAELHAFSLQMTVFGMLQLGIFALLKLRPDFTNKMFFAYCTSIGTVLLMVGLHNLNLIRGI